MNDKEDLLEIVRISIKNQKCEDCGKYPAPTLASELVTFTINCNKDCQNKNVLQGIIDEISINYFKEFYPDHGWSDGWPRYK